MSDWLTIDEAYTLVSKLEDCTVEDIPKVSKEIKDLLDSYYGYIYNAAEDLRCIIEELEKEDDE
jgi:hypothetical protein